MQAISTQETPILGEIHGSRVVAREHYAPKESLTERIDLCKAALPS